MIFENCIKVVIILKCDNVCVFECVCVVVK